MIDREFLYINREYFENNPDADPDDTSFLEDHDYLSDVTDYEEEVSKGIIVHQSAQRAN